MRLVFLSCTPKLLLDPTSPIRKRERSLNEAAVIGLQDRAVLEDSRTPPGQHRRTGGEAGSGHGRGRCAGGATYRSPHQGWGRMDDPPPYPIRYTRWPNGHARSCWTAREARLSWGRAAGVSCFAPYGTIDLEEARRRSMSYSAPYSMNTSVAMPRSAPPSGGRFRCVMSLQPRG